MSQRQSTEEQAKLEFAARVNEQGRLARLHGADPDCHRRLAEITAENEAECRKMEQQLSHDAMDRGSHL